MSAEHRRTAADWSIDPLAPLLQEYAASGTIVAGLDDEIRAALRTIASGELDPRIDAHEEYDRLEALLDEVQPQVSVLMARQLGREHGRDAAARWQREALGGHATGDGVALARRVLAGIEHDDDPPALLDVLPSVSEEYTATKLAADCGWPEPDVEDRVAHDRWDLAQIATYEAYATAFTDAMLTTVESACRSKLAQAPPDRTRGSELSGPDQGARPTVRPTGSRSPIPPGWEAVPAGRNGHGEDLEVVYDPDRYDILVAHGERGGTFPRLPHEDSADLMLDALATTGWELHGFAGGARVWVRERSAAERLAADHREAGKQPEVQFNDLGPTRPFLRPEGATAPIPPGWIAEPAGMAGTSSDALVEVVYNPQRHDVMRVPKSSAEAALNALADQGWTQATSDSTSDLLWRDRVAHTHASLERATAPPAAEIEVPGL